MIQVGREENQASLFNSPSPREENQASLLNSPSPREENQASLFNSPSPREENQAFPFSRCSFYMLLRKANAIKAWANAIKIPDQHKYK